VLPSLLGFLLALGTALPLAWKWQLGVRRTAIVLAALALVSSLVIASIGVAVELAPALRTVFVWLLTTASAVALVAYRFYRDPERIAPRRDNVIVSPADGEVIYVHPVLEGVLPVARKDGRACRLDELTKPSLSTENAVVIGISMNFLDVHVNRAPIRGKVTMSRHFPGSFGSLRRTDMLFDNERATTVIERGTLQVAVVQIASRLVRQIVTFVGEGDELDLGQRIGVIRFGSQVDLVLPVREGPDITVKVGERVRAGESILAKVGSGTDATSQPDTAELTAARTAS
jgi:phosphatidylserine decarboxylase